MDDRPPTPEPAPAAPPPRGDLARVWALSLAAGWAILAAVAGFAIAFDAHGVRDALDLGRLVAR
jgi:hypothetical protein